MSDVIVLVCSVLGVVGRRCGRDWSDVVNDEHAPAISVCRRPAAALRASSQRPRQTGAEPQLHRQLVPG